MTTANEYITWKDEGGSGPACHVNEERFEAWRRENCPGMTFGIPYGSKPEGMEDLGWMSRGQARGIARERGVEFVEA